MRACDSWRGDPGLADWGIDAEGDSGGGSSSTCKCSSKGREGIRKGGARKDVSGGVGTEMLAWEGVAISAGQKRALL
eukprot:scaffold37178_cov19-Tisochrysis_lutea.AAC.1